MIHVPSESVYKKLCAENTTLMFVPAQNGEIAILIKAPIIYLNEICSDCEIEFVFAVHQDSAQRTCLCSALRINDDPDKPITFLGVDKEKEYHDSLLQFIKEKKAPVYLYDEMNMNLAGTEASITDDDAKVIKELIKDHPEFCTEMTREELDHALDCFVYSIDSKVDYEQSHEIDTVSVKIAFSDWQKNECFIFQEDTAKKISVNESDEGGILEARAWFALEMMFPMAIHKNPYYLKGGNRREITDILAYYDYGNFLIETKALKSTEGFYKKSMERKVANVQKGIKKAIDQLVGGINTVKYNGEIFTKSGEFLSFGRSLSPQCLVLVSEIFPFGDWDEITQKLLDASEETGATFNLLDYKNFIRLLYGCNNNPKLFDVNLIGLAETLKETQNIHIELRHPGEIKEGD